MAPKRHFEISWPLPTFGSFSFFQASILLRVNKVLQKLTKSYKSEIRHLIQCCILIPRKCLCKTLFKAHCPPESSDLPTTLRQQGASICDLVASWHFSCLPLANGLRTPRESFFSKISNFWAWADILGWNFWGHFGRTINTHFGTVSSLFSIFQSLFLQKIKPLYPSPKYLFGSGIWTWAQQI